MSQANGESFELRVLVQEVVDLPGFVGDHQVGRLVTNDLAEQHEVGDHDLVHSPDRLERVQVVFAGLGLEVARLAEQILGGGVHSLSGRLEHPGDRILRQPVDVEI